MYTYVCMYIYIHMHICIYVCTYMYIYLNPVVTPFEPFSRPRVIPKTYIYIFIYMDRSPPHQG